MKFDLAGKTALVTGAGGGIGSACAELLAEEGVRIRLSARDPSRLDALVSKIRGMGGDVEVRPGDLASAETIAALVPENDEPDIIVHAAGHRFRYAKLHVASSEDSAQTYAIDFEAFTQLCKRALPGMMGKRYGRIVAITSMASLAAGSGSPHYAAAKAAVDGLVRAIAVDYGRYNVTANSIAAGFVATSRFAARATDENIAKFEAATSVKRIGDPREIAAPAVFLCSSAASYMTGSTLIVAGGAQLNNLW
ncbi:MAG TPA: SDR family oxidoreductase [Labilithrix sp.]|nr:SDR family oxidoreductase [Labilithrix sp.]